MGYLSVLVALVIIVINYFAGIEFQRIAKMKGFNETKYFWWSFLFGVIGMMMVIALPDRRSNRDQEAENDNLDELPDL